MFSFAGWSVVGNLGFSFKDQVANVILNIFFGTVVNAARGIALQVNGIIAGFSTNFMMALSPQITKQYANNNVHDSIKLVYLGCRFSFFLLLLIVTPVIVNINVILKIWLGVVPKYTSEFLYIALIAALINSMSMPLVTALQATGKIKLFQIVICIIMLCELPLSYLILYFGGKPYMAMYPTILVTLIGVFVRFIILKHIILGYNFIYFTLLVLKNLLLASISIILSTLVHNIFLNENLLSLFLSIIISFFIAFIIIYSFGINNNEKRILKSKIVKIIRI